MIEISLNYGKITNFDDKKWEFFNLGHDFSQLPRSGFKYYPYDALQEFFHIFIEFPFFSIEST